MDDLPKKARRPRALEEEQHGTIHLKWGERGGAPATNATLAKYTALDANIELGGEVVFA